MFERRKIYGHIRFSFYGITDTRLKPEDEAAALVQLYGETRMARRFFLFENLTLPSLRAQTDSDFTIIIMSSDIMPDRFKDRLRTIIGDDPRFVLDFSSHRNGALAFRKHIEASLGEGFLNPAVHFRLDDDDALTSSYISRLRQISYTVSVGTHITFPTGITLFPMETGSTVAAALPHRQFLIGLGLAIVCGQTFRKNPFQMMHGDVWRRWPVISEPRFTAFLRVHHYDNDTLANQDRVLADYRRLAAGRKSESAVPHIDAALAEGFSYINYERLLNLIPQISEINSLDDLPKI